MLKIIVMLLFLSCSVSAQELLKQIVSSLDALSAPASSRGVVSMLVKTPSGERTMTMQIWSKGHDFVLVKILTPAKDRGTGTLKVKTRVWNFNPKNDKVVPVDSTVMVSGWMGSDIPYAEFCNELSLASDYDHQLLPKDPKRPAVRSLKCTPKPGLKNPWGLIVIDVDEKTLLPVRRRNFDSQNRLVSTIHYKEVRALGGKMIPTMREWISETKAGYTTRVSYNAIEFDFPCDDHFFTLTRLREPLK